MIAIILEEDNHTRNVVHTMLRQLGYTLILEAKNTEEFDFICDQYTSKIRLIVSSFRLEEGLDLPLSRIIIQNPALNWVPLIILTNRSFHLRLNFTRTRLSRIDAYLHRPFGVEKLKQSIETANQRRAEMRNVVIVVGQETDLKVVEATYDSKKENHWKKVIYAKDLVELKVLQDTNGFRVGAILIDPAFATPTLGRYITRIKKDSSIHTVIAVLGEKPEDTFHFRKSADFFFSKDEEWEEIFYRCSVNLLTHWEATQSLGQIRKLLKSNKLEAIPKIINRTKKLPLPQVDLEEAKGVYSTLTQEYSSAIEHLKLAIELNPCHPAAYLKLIPLLNGDEQKEIIKKAFQFCPMHPQIKELVGAFHS